MHKYVLQSVRYLTAENYETKEVLQGNRRKMLEKIEAQKMQKIKDK